MNLDLRFDEVFDSPLEEVWKAVTDARILARWLMDNDFEPRVGHKFQLRDPPTATWRGWVECEVLELEPPRRMVWSWYGGAEGESTTQVVFALRREAGGTRLTLRHHGHASPAQADSMGAGWTRKMRVLERVLGPNYSSRVAFRSSPEKVFEAVATIEGIKRWWTPLVSGSTDPSSEFQLHFEGLAEHIVMRVEQATHPSLVRWTCRRHTGLDDEWDGTTLVFNVARRGAQGSELTFEHIGLTPRLDCFETCEQGWDHFLGSLAAYVDRGQGSPFGGRGSR